MRTLPATIVGVLLLASTPALAAPLPLTTFAPSPGGQISFTAPSDNIECIYTPPGGGATYVPADGGPELSCDRLAPTYLRFTLAASGPAELIRDVGDQSCCGDENPLPYGTRWRVAPLSCNSSTAGLACTRDDGHGFFISRAKVQAH